MHAFLILLSKVLEREIIQIELAVVLDIRGVHGSVSSVFFKFVTEPIGIGFVIIETDAYRLGSVFQPIAVRFDRLSLIGIGLFLFFI